MIPDTFYYSVIPVSHYKQHTPFVDRLIKTATSVAMVRNINPQPKITAAVIILSFMMLPS